MPRQRRQTDARRSCVRTRAGASAVESAATALDDDEERRGRLPLFGKGAVPAHLLAGPFAAESDEYEQRWQCVSGAEHRCSLDVAGDLRRWPSPSGARERRSRAAARMASPLAPRAGASPAERASRRHTSDTLSMATQVYGRATAPSDDHVSSAESQGFKPRTRHRTARSMAGISLTMEVLDQLSPWLPAKFRPRTSTLPSQQNRRVIACHGTRRALGGLGIRRRELETETFSSPRIQRKDPQIANIGLPNRIDVKRLICRSFAVCAARRASPENRGVPGSSPGLATWKPR